jgi:hypothetical protein
MSRIDLIKLDTTTHSDAVSAVEFGSSSEVYSIGDDQIINQFTFAGELLGPVRKIDDACVLDCHRAPSKKVPSNLTTKTAPSVEDTVALACTDGFFLVSCFISSIF